MNRDFKELLALLNAEQVKYLIIGGYAVSLAAADRGCATSRTFDSHL